jgi:hypothetical protein
MILMKTDKRSLRSLILKVKDWAASSDEWFAKFMSQFVRLRQVLLIVGSNVGDRAYIENLELPRQALPPCTARILSQVNALVFFSLGGKLTTRTFSSPSFH